MFQTIRNKGGKYIRGFVERRDKKKINTHPALVSLLTKYGRTSHSTGASHADYLALYSYIKTHKPKEVLECGTGFSTVVIAQALKENEEESGIMGHLVSMEENEKYYQDALRSLPEQFKNDSCVQIVCSPAVEDTYQVFRGIRYREIPKRPYDFVFVDGPDYVLPRGESLLAYDLDFLRLVEKSNHPMSAFIDTRTDTSYMYSLLFPNHFVYDHVRGTGIVRNVTKNDLIQDLIKEKKVVARVLARGGRHMQRPKLSKLFFGNY